MASTKDCATVSPPVFKRFSTFKVLSRSKSTRNLGKNQKEIKIVEVFPNAFRRRTGRRHVSCYTKNICLENSDSKQIPFIAVSYTVSKEDKTAPIYLDNKIVQIPTELADALQHFEHERLALRLWADAVCIEPNNIEERGYVMGKIADIFRHAEEVLVWLGQGGKESDNAMHTLAEIGNEAVKARAEAWIKAEYDEDLWMYNMDEKQMEIRHRWFSDGVATSYNTIIQNILERPWFKHVGSLQEAALNDNVHFVCGDMSIPKFVLWDAVTTITHVSHSIRAEKHMSMSQFSLPETFPEINFVSNRTLDFIIQPTCDTMESPLLIYL